MIKYLFMIFSIIFLSSCNSVEDIKQTSDSNGYTLSDLSADQAAQNLYRNLAGLNSQFLFGQANARSISARYDGAKNPYAEQSDSLDTVGSHPALIESDFMWYYYYNEKTSQIEKDSYFRTSDVNSMIAHFEDGGVIGYCWHIRDSRGDFYSNENNSSLFSDIVNDHNEARKWFLGEIDRWVVPALSVFREAGAPVIIRPFHEMNGRWFWWGGKNAADFVLLYRLFVDYLRDSAQVHGGFHNLIFAWSPNSPFNADSMVYYPGDEYVDIVGLDIYEPGKSLKRQLKKIATFASEHKKVFAVTETGDRRTYPEKNTDFWTDEILNAVNSDLITGRVSYVMSWYNARWDSNNLYFYTPYSGMNNPAALYDFQQFKDNRNVLFLAEMPDMYK